MMTEERANLIVDAVSNYADTAALLEMSPEEAARALNENGGDFTVEEVEEMGEALVTVAKGNTGNGELGAEDLDNVSGGNKGAYTNLLLSGASAICAIGSAGCAYAALAACCCW